MAYSEDTKDVQLPITHQQHRDVTIKRAIPNLIISPTKPSNKDRTYLDELSFSFQQPHSSLDTYFRTGTIKDDIDTCMISTIEAECLRDEFCLTPSVEPWR
jgi:hypothetical protein